MNATQKPEIKGMAPLLQVFDMPESLHFYCDILGFTVDQASDEPEFPEWVLLSLNNIQVMLNTAYERNSRPEVRDKFRTAGHTDTCLYFGAPDVEAAYHYFISQGLELREPIITKYGWKAIYLRDPDSYELCFHWPIGA